MDSRDDINPELRNRVLAVAAASLKAQGIMKTPVAFDTGRHDTDIKLIFEHGNAVVCDILDVRQLYIPAPTVPVSQILGPVKPDDVMAAVGHADVAATMEAYGQGNEGIEPKQS